MGHETMVEVDDVHWFAGYGPVPVGGECSHDCPHNGRSVIAWGPSLVHYELVECDSCGCRAWEAALPNSKGGIFDSHPWLERVDAVAALTSAVDRDKKQIMEEFNREIWGSTDGRVA